MDQPLYNALRVVHLIALIAWLGLSTGAWLLMRRLRRQGVSDATLYPAFAKIVDGEHHALALLLVSGAALLAVVGLDVTKTLWFAAKTALIVFVILPIEGLDIAKIGAVKRDPSPERIAAYDRFLVWGGAALMIASVAIIALGKFRPMGWLKAPSGS